MVPEAVMLERKPHWDRRRYARSLLHKTVELRLTDWLDIPAWGHDVSLGGICLTLPSRVTPGAKVRVGLTLSNDVCLDLRAVVANVRERDGKTVAGLRWLETDREVLDLVIDDLAAQRFIAQQRGSD
jgi:hypothetical protein